MGAVMGGPNPADFIVDGSIGCVTGGLPGPRPGTADDLAEQADDLSDVARRSDPHVVAPSAASDGRLPRANVGWTDDFDYRKTFLDANPEVGDVWVHHAVEKQVLDKYPGLFKAEEIHSLENLRGIPAGMVNRAIHLSEIRRSWNRFYRSTPNPTRQDVLDHASKIDRDLGFFFEPPIA